MLGGLGLRGVKLDKVATLEMKEVAQWKRTLAERSNNTLA